MHRDEEKQVFASLGFWLEVCLHGCSAEGQQGICSWVLVCFAQSCIWGTTARGSVRISTATLARKWALCCSLSNMALLTENLENEFPEILLRFIQWVLRRDVLSDWLDARIALREKVTVQDECVHPIHQPIDVLA